MVFYRDIWKSSDKPLPEKAVAVGNSLLIINSVDMIDQLNLPIKLTYSLISVVCLKGEAEFTIGMHDVKLTGNTMLVMAPGQTLQSGRASDDFQGFSIVAGVQALGNILPYMSKVVMCFLHLDNVPVIKLTEAEAETQVMFHDLLQRLVTHSRRKSYSDLVIKRMGESIFYETLGLYDSHIKELTPTRRRRGEEIFYKFLTLVEKNYKKERGVSFYAEQIPVTSKHLSTVVKECSGRTAGDWIDAYVILEAKMLLSNTDKSVQVISHELNFPNQSFFGKFFKNHVGLSPRQFRNKHAGI